MLAAPWRAVAYVSKVLNHTLRMLSRQRSRCTQLQPTCESQRQYEPGTHVQNAENRSCHEAGRVMAARGMAIAAATTATLACAATVSGSKAADATTYVVG
jgi:hypothetical protein